MLQPNRTKYRKDQKGRNYGMAQRGADVSFGRLVRLKLRVVH